MEVTKATGATRLRVGSVVALAAGLAALVAWALRDHAEFLPSADANSHPLSSAMSATGASGHGHGAGSGYQAPPAVMGDALASYAGLAVFALHVLMIAVAAVASAMRPWFHKSDMDTHGVLVRLAFAGSAAVVSAVVTAGMAALLLGTAISFAATLAASMTVLRYSFVLLIVFSVVFGVPLAPSWKEK